MADLPALPERIEQRAHLEALLASATNYEDKLPRDPLRKALNLGRVADLLASVGDPQHAPRTVHIAGSKGKGSVARMVASGLRAAGRGPVGLYTSPHLEDLAERIAIDGQPAGGAALARAGQQILPHVRATRGSDDAPTFFELFTAVAWLVFQQAGCSDVVLETGLGGRLDATNVCAPAVTILTLIELEHTRLLGDTLAAIAAEKAGILKAGVPVIAVAPPPEVRAVFDEQAALVGTSIRYVDDDVPAGLRLPGAHHRSNARAAFEALQLLGVDEATAWRGIGNTKLPGVLEVLAEQPRVVIDGAHTKCSAEATRHAVNERWPDGPVVLLTALLEEKDVAGVVGALAADVTHVVITRVDSPRCVAPNELATAIASVVDAPITVEPDRATALTKARALAGPGGTVLVAGSIYLAGEVRTQVRGSATS